MTLESDLLGAFEVHSPEGIRDALAAGASPTELIKGQRPIDALIESYLRSSRFATCIRVLTDAGATIGNPLLEAVLLDDDDSLRDVLRDRGESAANTRQSIRAAFTSCEGVSPLHLCAEFNSVRCARVLLDAGASVNDRAGVDPKGFGGQTPLFHTVNSIHNYCRPMMEMLVEAGADLAIRVKGLVWGRGADWETLVLDVSAISYAQCGLLPQFHRREADVYSNLAYLFERRYWTALPMHNVPNRYLSPPRA